MFIDVDFLLRNSITANQLLFLEIVKTQNINFTKQYVGQFTEEEIDDLLVRGFLNGEKYLIKNLTLGKKCCIFVDEDAFFEKWWLLWPSGIKSGGYYIKSDKLGCKSKILKFKNKRPQFTEDIIFKATQSYLDRMRSNGYRGVQLASNFIEKNGISMLAGECENWHQKTAFLEDA